MREQDPTSLRQTSDKAVSLPKMSSGLPDRLLDNDATAIVTAKRPAQQDNGYPCELLDYWADRAIALDRRVVGWVITRRRMSRYRSSKHSHAHPRFWITDRGINVSEVPGEARPNLTGGRTAIV